MWWKLDVDQAGHITLDTAPPWLTPSAAASAADSPSQPAADSAAENSDVTVPLPEANAQMPKADSSRLDLQGMQTRSRQTAEGVQIGCEQPQQQWRDHWKQCWTPIHHHLTLGEKLVNTTWSFSMSRAKHPLLIFGLGLGKHSRCISFVGHQHSQPS